MGTRPQGSLGPAEARAIALRYLNCREYGCRELALKLEQRGAGPATAATVVEQLESGGLVSDARYTEVFVRSKAARLFGPLKIQAQLRQRGIAQEVIRDALGGYEEQWESLADAWVAKRAAEPLDRKSKARLYRGGRSRGFSHDQIMRALDRFGANS